MRKLNKSSELLWLMGNVFVALGVAICSKADLGVSMIAAPAFIIAEALSPLTSFFSVGVVEYIFQGILLAVLCFVIRKFNWRFLLAFLVAVLYGYTLNFFLWLLGPVSFSEPWLRWVMLLVGDVCTAIGVACFFRTYMPLQVYELFVAELSHVKKLDVNKTKWGFDASLLAVSLVLVFTLFDDVVAFNWSTICYASFHSIGLGTIVTTVINSPIIKLVGRLIDKVFCPTPLWPSVRTLLRGRDD